MPSRHDLPKMRDWNLVPVHWIEVLRSEVVGTNEVSHNLMAMKIVVNPFPWCHPALWAPHDLAIEFPCLVQVMDGKSNVKRVERLVARDPLPTDAASHSVRLANEVGDVAGDFFNPTAC